jgi:hypothetical protein
MKGELPGQIEGFKFIFFCSYEFNKPKYFGVGLGVGQGLTFCGNICMLTIVNFRPTTVCLPRYNAV